MKKWMKVSVLIRTSFQSLEVCFSKRSNHWKLLFGVVLSMAGNAALAGDYPVNPAGVIELDVNQQAALAGGFLHSLGLKSDGSVTVWGDNSYGQTNVPAPNTDISAVAAGWYHSLGMKSDGNIVAWGRNNYGQTDVPLPNTDFTAVAAGSYHSLGLKSDGSIAAWGHNAYGQTNVPLPNTDFVAVAAGHLHSLGLKSDGSIIGWGGNTDGQTNVPSPNTDFVAVAGGSYHSLGLKSDGSIVAWGYSKYGQTDVPSPNTNFVAVSGGAYHSLGLKSDGSIVAWGSNNYGQTNVPAPNTGFVAVAAGIYHSMGLKSDGSLVVWGYNDYGQTNVTLPNTGFGLSEEAVIPGSGPWSGGYQVTILGTNLCNGTLEDVTDVTLNGTSVSSIDYVSGSTKIVVTAAAGTSGTGDVTVYSISHGVTTKTDGFTYLKTDQTIHFPNPGQQEVTNVLSLAATATSGLPVSFSVDSGPASISGGTNLSFSCAGHVTILATQNGDSNWNAAPVVTNSFDVTGVITNVTPPSATMCGGTEVTLSGLWLGSGTDITNVLLCNVPAVIVTQDIHRVVVIAGVSPVAATADIVVQSTGYGAATLVAGFTYSPVPPPPVALSAVNIGSDRFTARWTAAESATHYFIDVSQTTNFTTYVGVYSNCNVGDVTSSLVSGLSDGETYYYRIRAANIHGSSLDSNLIEVPVSTNTPYIRYEVTNGVVSAGSSDVIDLTELFHGSDMTYEVISNSNPALVSATFNGTDLILNYTSGMSGTAQLTIRVTDTNGFYVDTVITVSVAPQPGLSLGPVVFNPQNGLFEQIATVSNASPTLAAQAVTLTVTNLSAGASLYNATGTDEHGNPEILWIGTLAPQGTMDFTLQYYTALRGVVPSATVLVSLSLTEPEVEVSGEGVTLSGMFNPAISGGGFLLEFATVPGRTYAIQYTDSLTNSWKTVQPSIVAPATRVQWIDSGPPGTVSAPGAANARFYRVLELQ